MEKKLSIAVMTNEDLAKKYCFNLYQSRFLPDGRIIVNDRRTYGANIVLANALRQDEQGKLIDKEGGFLRFVKDEELVNSTGLDLGKSSEVAFVQAWHSKEYGPCMSPCDPKLASHIVVKVDVGNVSGWFTEPGYCKSYARAMGFWRFNHDRVTRKFGRDYYVLPIGYTICSKDSIPIGARVIRKELDEYGPIGHVACIDSRKARECQQKYHKRFVDEDAALEKRLREIKQATESAQTAKAKVFELAQPFIERWNAALINPDDAKTFGTDARDGGDFLYLSGQKLPYDDAEFLEKLEHEVVKHEENYQKQLKDKQRWQEFIKIWRERFEPYKKALEGAGYTVEYEDSYDSWMRSWPDREDAMKLRVYGGFGMGCYGYKERGVFGLKDDYGSTLRRAGIK